MVPYDPPADPYARPAPPIAVAPIEIPDIESVAPEVGKGAKPAPKLEPPSLDDSAAPPHHH